MSSSLTKLKMAFREDIPPHLLPPLNQLTQLQGLLLEGLGRTSATVPLQLPQLTKLTLKGFGSITVSLRCPQLKALKLLSLHRLQELRGMPDGVESLCLHTLGFGCVPLEQMLPAQGLKHLVQLRLQRCPGQLTRIREAYTPSNLTTLLADETWTPLVPFQPPLQGLPCNLKQVLLCFPMHNGIPVVLEQLSNLESLRLFHIGPGQMHLTRSLDPFLDMLRLTVIALDGDWSGHWTPAALRLLGLAERRVLHKHKSAPLGTTCFSLTY